MKKTLRTYMLILPISAVTLFVSLPEGATAQLAIAEVIKAGIKKVIKAIDLQIQRMQNRTIWLQNAQKVLENQLSKLKLDEIADWTERQRDLYGKYYDELWKIKSAISYYQRVKDLTETQVAIVEEYRRAWNLFQQDTNFTPEELLHMGQVYTGILEESVKNLDQVLLVVNSFRMQMSDAARLETIRKAGGKIDGNYNDLRQFNRQNSLLSIQRARSSEETKKLKDLYGIE
ncbi:conjugal transfer protein TraI [Parapedobacter sp. DT-150]|uniref:conjugal transfer protein TraI n=1 Tax=Parapedobacter sp. DT-150 TaxID=3396162 RepID=UPI003F1A430C